MPAGVFRCTDGELMLVVGNDGQFQRTCAVLGEPELASDPRFVRTTTASCTARRSWRSLPACS
jgi:crotonobetainyl-CoA:carnitine CoA-transferase CaiB-like acyl-CoA transferase